MSASNPAVTLLFWVMFVVGGLSLATGLVLPPWVEYRELVERHAKAQLRTQELENQLAEVQRRIEHLQDDPAYLERLARKELGIGADDDNTVPVEMTPIAQPHPVVAESAPAVAERAVEVLDEARRSHPLVRLYAQDETRPFIMALSAGLLIAAIVLLGRNTVMPRELTEEQTSA